MFPEQREYFGCAFGVSPWIVEEPRRCCCDLCGDDIAENDTLVELKDGTILDLLCWSIALQDATEEEDEPERNRLLATA